MQFHGLNNIFKGTSVLTITMNSFRTGQQTNSENCTEYYHRDTCSCSYEL